MTIITTDFSYFYLFYVFYLFLICVARRCWAPIEGHHDDVVAVDVVVDDDYHQRSVCMSSCLCVWDLIVIIKWDSYVRLWSIITDLSMSSCVCVLVLLCLCARVCAMLLDLPPGTRFQFTPRTSFHTQCSADNLKLTCWLFLYSIGDGYHQRLFNSPKAMELASNPRYIGGS